MRQDHACHQHRHLARERRGRVAIADLDPQGPCLDRLAARRFLEELLGGGRVARGRTRIGIVANRVREQNLVYRHLEESPGDLGLPVLGHRRERQNYGRASRGD